MAKENQIADLTAKQVTQGAMILAVKEPKDYYDIRETSFRYTPEHYQVWTVFDPPGGQEIQRCG